MAAVDRGVQVASSETRNGAFHRAADDTFHRRGQQLAAGLGQLAAVVISSPAAGSITAIREPFEASRHVPAMNRSVFMTSKDWR
jgi:hypothetical protein